MTLQVRLFVFFLLITSILPAQAQSRSAYRTYVIPPVNIDHETATLSLRFIVEENGLLVRDITPASITISEPATDIQVSAASERPLTLAILVDLSFGSDADLIQSTLRAFFDSYYQDGDQITFYILDAGSTRDQDVQRVTIASREQATTTINALARSERLFVMQHALDLAYEDLTALPDDPLQMKQVLYVSSLINRPEDAAEITRFADADILVHAVQAHRTRDYQTALFRELVNNGRGLFANNFEGLLVIGDSNFQPINTLKVLYDTIASNRLIYTLTYRTASQSLSANRPVTLTIALPSGASVESSFTYEWEFQEPLVTFTSARDFAIGRTPFLQSNGTIGFEPQSRVVPVQISFPDGVARRIESIRLDVLDAINGTVLQSALVLQPELGADGAFSLDWNLSDYGVQGSAQNVRIQVTVTDELGISSAAAVDGSVQVSVLPPTPTPIPTATPIPVPTATAVPVETASVAPATGVVSDQPTQLLFIANALLMLVVLLLIVRVRRMRNQQQQPRVEREPVGVGHVVKAEKSEVQRGARTWPSDEIQPEAVPVAPVQEKQEPAETGQLQYKLVLREGTEQLSIRQVQIDAPEFTIGRASECNLVIDLPTVSTRHCAIRIDARRGVLVRDLGSINGTFINGERIRSGEERFVPLGSELWVTKAHIFEVWDAEKEIQISKDEEQAKLSTLFISPDAVVFKPLPGLRYAPDEGDPIDDEYAPV